MSTEFTSQECLNIVAGVNDTIQANLERLTNHPTNVTPADITVKGGVERVIDSATGDIARTTNGWIEDEKYGFNFLASVGTSSAEFDTAITRTGSKTLKLSTLATGSYLEVTTGGAYNPMVIPFTNSIPLKGF